MVMILKIKASTRNLCIVCSVTTPNRKENTLVDVDSKSPNFALMKISTYNKVKGDNVVLIHGSKIDLGIARK